MEAACGRDAVRRLPAGPVAAAGRPHSRNGESCESGSLIAAAGFPILSANVASDPEPLPVQSQTIIGRPGALKIAVLGLTTP